MIYSAHAVFLFVFDDSNQDVFPMRELTILWSKDGDIEDIGDPDFLVMEEHARKLMDRKVDYFAQRLGCWEYQGIRRNLQFPSLDNKEDTRVDQFIFSDTENGHFLFHHDIEFEKQADIPKFLNGEAVRLHFFD